MTTYIKYQCSVCRRNKDIERDPLRAAPNKCTITKGCAGILIAYDQTSIPVPVAPIVGAEDWYPRGQTKVQVTPVASEETVSLATSENGALVMAVQADLESSVPDFIDIELLQRRVESVATQDYTYRPTVNTTVFTGRDANGKILRIDSAAISDGRVEVRVNGVLSETAVLTTNTVTFPSNVSAGSVVSVRVQLEKETVERTLRLTRNSLQTPTASRGAWANVDSFFRYDAGTFKRWWVYSVDTLTGLNVGKIKVISTGTVLESMLLLAHAPFEGFDRYLDFIVPTEPLLDDFLLSLEMSSNSLIVSKSLVEEIYPPLRLTYSLSYVVEEERETVASSEIVSDEENVLLKSTIILGPK